MSAEYIIYKERGKMVKMKKFIEEFKSFALRGNAMDMAVGVMIGGAFTGVVTSLMDNFIMPFLKFVTRAQDYTIQDVWNFATSFVSTVINFLITAFVLFLLIKSINGLLRRNKKEEAPATKICPYCKTSIHIEATRCPNCTSELE